MSSFARDSNFRRWSYLFIYPIMMIPGEFYPPLASFIMMTILGAVIIILRPNFALLAVLVSGILLNLSLTMRHYHYWGEGFILVIALIVGSGVLFLSLDKRVRFSGTSHDDS